MRWLMMLMLLMLASGAMAQSRKKRRSESSSNNPTTLEPYYPQQNYEPKRNKKKKVAGPSFNSEKEYYERLEALEKTRRYNERMMDKPQYSDPSYFGHKRKPKKHKPGKMKFCKECGLRH